MLVLLTVMVKKDLGKARLWVRAPGLGFCSFLGVFCAFYSSQKEELECVIPGGFLEKGQMVAKGCHA